MPEHKKVKILVGYHKPSVLLKSDILVPIHLGRAVSKAFSKDGASITNEDDLWMQSNLIGDNTGDNISEKNRYYNEMTGIYWAWKNQDQLGNPDYIGFMHYRRWFIFDDEQVDQYRQKAKTIIFETQLGFDFLLESDYERLFDDKKIIEAIDGIDILVPQAFQLPETLRKNWERASHFPSNIIDVMFDAVKRENAEIFPFFEAMFNSTTFHACSMFVMKKPIFDEYCEWQFSILSEIEKKVDISESSVFGQRLLGYISELLSSAFFEWYQHKNKQISKKNTLYIPNPDLAKVIRPSFDADTQYTPIALAANNKNTSYLGVLIKSIVSTASFRNNYDIYILQKDITPANKLLLNRLITDVTNIRIHFVNINAYMSLVDEGLRDLLNTSPYELDYYKFVIPTVFSEFNKILYLHADTLVISDVAELYKQELDDKMLGGCEDTQLTIAVNDYQDKHNALTQTYYHQIFGNKKVCTCVQDSVLLMDLAKIRSNNAMQTCFNIIKHQQLQWHGKDLLNLTFDGQIKFLKLEWNLSVQSINFALDTLVSVSTYKNYIGASARPSLINFAGGKMPWESITVPYSDYFWRVAINTPFYGELMDRLQYKAVFQDISKLEKTVRQIKKYRLLSKITFGKKKQHYLAKIQKLVNE